MDARNGIEARLDGRVLRNLLRDRLTQLAAEVDRASRDRGFREALDAMRRFWRYSFFNQFLIKLQRSDARQVAAKRVWESLGRQVKDGEKPMGVLAPTKWRRGRGSLPVPVFDIRQTRGRRVSRLDVELRGRSPHVKTLERAATGLGISVEYGPMEDGVLGRQDSTPPAIGAPRATKVAGWQQHGAMHRRGRRRGARSSSPLTSRGAPGAPGSP